MAEEEPVDTEKELENLLTKVQPNLQDVIKRVILMTVIEIPKKYLE